MKKSHTWLLLGGGAVALYLLSQQSASAQGQGQQGQGQLPSSGGWGGGQPYSGGGSGYSGGIAGLGATRPRFRR